ncbi:hypothetical protein K493DRAFT_6622 [Basidiobolus meristosporus CBS 931.73]|uniref:Uncharacterized protein n=1 Tax=Basidiobolus meristosporus CBS 931.73 TaxID=1314790 RepID=A0A1Y1VYQ8_9FUNG|nr:hypothetical protein K493DRAFT_6622 [Basidiobolus meristosporus CBS 931.73]|eukprot:ORX66401.1 hypothetical protein K493DRAFT_6622 [Basidiobolus meristosporus CBS 931.73]
MSLDGISLLSPHCLWSPIPKKDSWVYPDVFRFKGSVLPAIFPHIVAITAFTWLIVYLYEVRKISAGASERNRLVFCGQFACSVPNRLLV